MKIRIRANTIRIRLTKSEVDRLCTMGAVEETTTFTETSFGYGIRISSEYDQLHATFKDNRITMYLPEALAQDWHRNEQVGFSNEMSLPENKKLSLLLEKDFSCLSPRGEDESDHYINPKAME